METKGTEIPCITDAIDALSDLMGASFLLGCMMEYRSFSEYQDAGLYVVQRTISGAHDVLRSYLEAQRGKDGMF